MSTSDLFRCEGLTVARSGQPVLKDVNLQVSPGEIVAITGRNGAGKTTLLESIAGILPMQNGALVLKGRGIDRLPSHARARLGIHLVPDRGVVFPNLTVGENLLMTRAAAQRSSSMPAYRDQFPFLDSHSALKAGRLSGGQKRILALVRALSNTPGLLLIDEFSEGLQPNAVRYFLTSIQGLCATGAGCILVVHTADWARNHGLSTRLLASGTLVAV